MHSFREVTLRGQLDVEKGGQVTWNIQTLEECLFMTLHFSETIKFHVNYFR